MIESTKRALTEPCPEPGCGKPAGTRCRDSAPYVHPSRRNLFYIDSGRKKKGQKKK
jgi:hypothetical protein